MTYCQNQRTECAQSLEPHNQQHQQLVLSEAMAAYEHPKST
jgi:hypothetical protein